ncbi:MAG: hypothetical protein KDA58_07725 [Planctomycetaceae bacterium]|nr:hypothetical protein [Planctomycetaceae bacterium]
MRFKRTLLSTSLLCCGLLLGCPAGDEYNTVPQTDVTNTDPVHEHAPHGPHGGHILELGAYHGEIAMGEDRVVSLYVLGEDAATAVPVEGATATLHLENGEEHLDIALTAAPLEGEADGSSSRFSSAADAIPEAIKDIEGLKGEVELKVGDTTAKASLSHDHEGHDHDHGHAH